MRLDLEQIMILLQRRYHSLQEIGKLTSEIQNAVSRRDEVSASLPLDMRAEEIENTERCQQEIWLMAEKGQEEAGMVRQLMTSDPAAARPPGSFEEQKIYEIRRKSRTLLKEIQERDRMLNRRVGGDKSFYGKTDR